MALRFLHLADLHLDSAYGGREETRRRLRQATFEALSAAVTFALDEELDAVLIAGDAFDDGRLGFDARSHLRRELQRLSARGITVVYCTGNHDPGGAGRSVSTLGLGADVSDGAPIHIVDGKGVETVPIHDGDEHLADVVTVGHVTEHETRNLSLDFLLDRSTGVPTIGMLHTQVGSAAGADGHAAYAPCAPADLARTGYAYWALGHVHVRGRAAADVPAWYPGNLQGRNPKETGPKGGLLVAVDRDGLVEAPRFVPFAPLEFHTFEVGEASTPGDTMGFEPEHLARTVAEHWRASLGGRGGALAPREAVVRAVLSGGWRRSLEAQIASSEARGAFEDATAAELGMLMPRTQVLEVQLRAGDIDAGPTPLPTSLLTAPSALGEALRLAGALADDPRLADGLNVDWSPLGEGGEERGRRIERLSRDLQALIVSRAHAGAVFGRTPGGARRQGEQDVGGVRP